MNTSNRIKTVLSIAAVAMAILGLTAHGARAAIVVEEQFIYDPVEVNIDGQNGGTGFDGPWVSTISHGRIYWLVEGLSFSTLPVAGNALSRYGSSGRAEAHRLISSESQTSLTRDGTTMWFSALFQEPANQYRHGTFLFGTDAFTTAGTPTLAAAGYGFGFTIQAAPDGSTQGNGTINAIAFNGSTAPIVVAGTFTPNPINATVLIVGKINWKPDGTPDELFLFNVTDLSTEPAEETAIVSITNLDFAQSAFDTIALWDSNNAITDEIRFGNTFANVMGNPTPPTQATNPNPAHLAVDVPVETDLSWTRGEGALEDEVYFGTDPCALTNVATIYTPNPPLYNPGDPNLIASTTYYWQIVEVNGVDRYEGDIWEFTTVRGEAEPNKPLNGALIKGDTSGDNLYTKLIFDPGATTVDWKCYFNEDYSKVESRHPDANLGPPPYPGFAKYTYWVGYPGVHPEESLVRGNRYYWTVDSNDAKGNTFYGDVWEFAVYPYCAFDPSPPNEALLISTTPFLSWLPGVSVEEHDIYIGTSWEDVNNAEFNPSSSPPEYVITRSEPNYQVITPLPNSTKIYWRVDEVVGRGPPDFIPTEFYKGNVWCFTTIPDFPLTDPNLVGWWKFDMGFGPTAWDWSGHDNHGTLMGDPQWVASGMVDGAMDFDGTDDYIWTGKSASDFGVAGDHAKSVSVWVFTRAFNNGGIWDVGARSEGQDFSLRTLGGNNQWRVQYWGAPDHDFIYDSLNKWVHFALVFDPPSHSTCYANGAVVSEVNDATLNTSTANPFQIGLYGWPQYYFNGLIDDLRLYNNALSAEEVRRIGAPPEAWNPSPYDGQASVPVTTPLQWMPGKYAAQHDVYFGTDKAAVENATPTTPGIYKGRIDANSLSVPLDAAELYYWRIDEVNDSGPEPYMWKGNTWMFRTVGAAGGLRGDYYEHTGAASPAGFEVYILSRIDPEINFNWGNGSPDVNVTVDNFSTRWSGHVEPLVSGDWMFWTNTDDGVRLWIDDVLVIDDWVDQSASDNNSPRIPLVAGTLYDVRMEYYENGGSAVARLSWDGPSTPRQIIPPINLWPPLFATTPRPRDGATIDDRTPALEWMPGINVRSLNGHELYFSSNFDDVNNRNPGIKETLSDPCRPYPAGPRLELGTTYYWLVDEVGLSDRWNARTVWSFTISECLSLDNFEDYNDRGELREVWRDGNADVVWGGVYPYLYLVQGGSSGSNLNVSTAVGAPFDGATGPVPPTPLNEEAMVLRYDNDGETYVGLPGEEDWVYDAPYYSEIEANTVGDNSLDVGQGWDSDGVKALSLSFQGHPMSDGSYFYHLDPGLPDPWPFYTQSGRGRDIQGRHDEFYFFGQYPFTGEGSVQVEVLRMDNTNGWAKAGVMIREKWTPYSKFAAVFMTPDNGVAFQYRVNEDGRAQTVTKPGVSLPQYVKLLRNIGGTFEAKHSANGFSWEDVNAPDTAPVYPEIVMGTIADPNIYAGSAVTSHNANQTCVADFNNLLVSPSGGYVFGDIGTNDPEQLYIALSDGVNTSVVEHNDVNAATLTSWQEWNIKLSDFTTVNLDAIKKVYIGLGYRDDPVQGGSGAIYVDDIRACPPKCIPSLAKPLYDIAQPYDCVVDEKDLALVGVDWLLRDRLITTTAPSDVNLVAYYEFEGNANDSGINALHGTEQGGPSYADGVFGQAIVLDGVDDYVDCNNNNPLYDITGQVTVSAWIKLNQGGLDQKIASNQDGIAGGYKMGVFGDDRAEFEIRTSANAAVLNRGVAGGTVLQTDVWYHVVGVYSEGNYIRTYVNGDLDRELVTTEILGSSTGALVLGREPFGARYFNGQIDDLRLYDSALSHEEVAYIFTNGAATLHFPIPSDADVYQGEAPGNQWINFNDYALIADKYLEQTLWPTP